MRHLFKYEHRQQPLASAATFSSRLVRNGRWAAAVIIGSLAIGTSGYMRFEGMGFIDAYLNAAMILSGMGPLGPLQNDAAKIFAALYAIASGLLLFAIAGLILAPVYHRILHRFHLPDTDEESDKPPKSARRKDMR